MSVYARFTVGQSRERAPANAQIAATNTGNLATSLSMETVAPL